jgi:hypothetical protein
MVKAAIASGREIENFIKSIVKFKTSQPQGRLQAALSHTVDHYLMNIYTIEAYAHCAEHLTPSKPSYQWVTQLKADDVNSTND